MAQLPEGVIHLLGADAGAGFKTPPKSMKVIYKMVTISAPLFLKLRQDLVIFF